LNKRDKSSPDAAIAGIAVRQHGVITTAQLLIAGISRATITNRVRRRYLHRVHRGVYAVGHPQLSDEGRWTAAVLACGEGAVLSHLSAAELWRIRRRRLSEAVGGESGAVHVTVPRTPGKRKRRGIALHRSCTLADSDRTRRDGIPVTTPARTLADLRPLLSPAQFAAAVREAEFLRLPLGTQVGSGGARRRGGRPASDGGPERARSELEAHMLGICRRHRLPEPEVNAGVDRFEVDFVWREARLIVEVNGWESHRTRSAFEEDRARDARLAVLGYEVIRFTWRKVTGDRRGVANTVRALLRARSD
jgi:very-short-patch-repair endonuclease